MAKPVTFLLIVLCLLVVFWSLVDRPDAPVAERALEGEPLKLLSELTDAELGNLALPEGAGEPSRQVSEPIVELPVVAEPVVEMPAVEPVGQPVCMSIGELRAVDDIRLLEAKIEERGVEVLRVTRTIDELGPYMVYIPPMSSDDEARTIVELLLSDGLDSIIIRDPPYVNGVSLGVFRSDENSAELLARVRALDYDVRRRRMSVPVELYSLLLSGSELSSIEESFWQKIRSDYDGILVEEKSCEEVASVSNFQ